MAKENKKANEKERGATLLVSVLILALLTVFVAAALTNTTSSTVVTFNDASSSQAFYAAYAGLEKMSKEFSDIFNVNTNPSKAQLDGIKSNFPAYIPDVTFKQNIRFLRNIDPNGILLETGPFAGLRVLRDEYELSSTATTKTGVQVQLTRSFYNNLIPIFQFGIFGTRDLEFYNGPDFNFGGRVHTNGDLYLTHSGQLFFGSTTTVVGEVVRDLARNGIERTSTKSTQIKSPTGQNQPLRNPSRDAYKLSGSVIGGPNIPTKPKPGSPNGTSKNPAFLSIVAPMGGRLVANSPVLRLPFENGGNKPIELIRRTDSDTEKDNEPNLFYSRYYNKPGLRVTLSDTQDQLPGKTGGIQLDPPNPTDNRYGYIPKPLGTYQASRVNGHRVRGWIKIETVNVNDNGDLLTADVTEDILRLGVTVHDPASGRNDTMSVFRLQRYAVDTDGRTLTVSSSVPNLNTPATPPNITVTRTLFSENNKFYIRKDFPATKPTNGSTTHIYEVDDYDVDGDVTTNTACGVVRFFDTPPSQLTNCASKIPDNTRIAFPITMYDTREGLVLDSPPPGGTTNGIEPRGLFTLIDIDMQNLKRLLSGAFDNAFQNAGASFRANKVPSPNNGWIVYLSDRRGDKPDFKPAVAGRPARTVWGRYEMETVFGFNDYIPPPGTTLFNIENTDDDDESVTTPIQRSIGPNGESTGAQVKMDLIEALTKGPYTPNGYQNTANRINLRVGTGPGPNALFRRAVRLVNGQDLSIPGSGSLTPEFGFNLNRGVTVATENPCYVQGNYNTGIPGTGDGAALDNPTAPNQYPGTQVPASVVADAVTLLSNNWKDINSITSPYSLTNRRASRTAYRFAVLTGRPRSGLFGQGGAVDPQMWGVEGTTGEVGGRGNAGDPSTPTNISNFREPDDVRLYGGVHNFLRYIEDWGGLRLFYLGALIDGWDSWQGNGNFKCCHTVYGAPNRDYTFNTAYLDPKQLPPGTPNLQYILSTSFRQNLNPNGTRRSQ